MIQAHNSFIFFYFKIRTKAKSLEVFSVLINKQLEPKNELHKIRWYSKENYILFFHVVEYKMKFTFL